MHSDESDRMLRAARIFARAVSLFEGDFQSARDWFASPNNVVNGVSPLEFSSTELGAREVEVIISRLERGIPL